MIRGPKRGPKPADLMPSAAESKKLMDEKGSQFTRCPNGHVLPHRTEWGRCSPADCADLGEKGTGSLSQATSSSTQGSPQLRHATEETAMLPRGMEGIQPAGLDHAESIQARAHHALEILRGIGVRSAREAAGNFPPLPKPPSDPTLTEEELVILRAKQLGPYMFEDKVLDALYGDPDVRRRARDEILAIAGFTTKGPNQPVNTTPPIILNINQFTPYDQQLKGATINVSNSNGRTHGSAGQDQNDARGTTGARGGSATGYPWVRDRHHDAKRDKE